MDQVIQSMLKIMPVEFTTFETIMEGTLAAVSAILWVFVIAIQLARPYMLRTVEKFSLRVGADLWWLIYVGMRDLLLAVTFLLGTLYFMPDVFGGQPLPITGPLAEALLFAGLFIKLTRDTDGDERAFVLESRLLAAGAAIYLIPYLVVNTLGGYWTGILDWLLSTTNAAAFSGLSVPAFVIWAVSILTVIVLSVIAVSHTLQQTRTPVSAHRPQPAPGDD
ncbi:MAG TPA: hypothetical protein VNM16_12330 [Bacillota bacterium]|nr:hypothetical protein [Bacillota bacterium]